MKQSSRNKQGQFVHKTNRAPTVICLLASVAVGAYLSVTSPVIHQELDTPFAKGIIVIAPKVYAAGPITIEDKIRDKFGKNADKMIAIGTCESHLNPQSIGDQKLAYKVNGKEYGKSYGIFQVRHLPGRPDPEKLLDADTNIEMAYQISNGGEDTGAWVTCSRKAAL